MPTDPRTHARFLDCRDDVLNALRIAASGRREYNDHGWVVNERKAMAIAANNFAAAHGISRRITVDDVERVEQRAVGHVDYASKVSLYVAELLVLGSSDAD